MFLHREVASGFNWNLTWNNYKNGFGSSDSLDFWMGLDRLHLLTTSGSYRLRMEWQEAFSGKDYWMSVEYWTFYIEDEAAFYRMHASGYVDGDDGRGALYVRKNISYLTRQYHIGYTRHKLIRPNIVGVAFAKHSAVIGGIVDTPLAVMQVKPCFRVKTKLFKKNKI